MAQAYPNRPVRLIAPYGAGGSYDLIARIVAQKLGEQMGQQVIVDNRPGGNTIIGSEALLKSSPDGYTVMVTSNTHVVTPLLVPTPY
ncbi:MAG: Bug family tripartite tricarboxylate transporter substrate binding protein, partial [Burkholderiales bacterium]